MGFDQIITTTEKHYSKTLENHGATFKGVDWGSENGQQIRFEQLLRFLDLDRNPSITDYGCGYGALVDILAQMGFKGEYQGYDISEPMCRKAVERCRDLPIQTRFTHEAHRLEPADYTVISGIFNIKLETPDDQWLPYILTTLEKVRAISQKGFVFNALSRYTPEAERETDLFYADSSALFTHCMERFSHKVVLCHDYPLNDFTIFVRLAP